MRPIGNIGLISLMLLSMTIWGGTWTSSKVIANMAAPEVLIFWRFLFTAVSMLPVMFLYRKSFSIPRKSIGLLLLGTLFLLLYNKFFFWGLQNGLAGAGGVLVTTLNPILTFLFSIIIFRRKAKRMQLAGLTIGLIGGAIILHIWSIDLTSLFASGNAFFLLATTCWALLTITSEKSKRVVSPFVFSFYVYCFLTIIDFFLALPSGVFRVFSFGHIFWWNILYMSVFATTFATTVFFAAYHHHWRTYSRRCCLSDKL